MVGLIQVLVSNTDVGVQAPLVHHEKSCNCNGYRAFVSLITKMDKKEAYRLVPSAFNKKKV